VLRAHVDDHVLIARAFGGFKDGHACLIAHQCIPPSLIAVTGASKGADFLRKSSL
jgi:hypothetical protein